MEDDADAPADADADTTERDTADTAGRATGTDAEGPTDELAWETTDSEIDYACPGFDVRMDDVVLPDGTATAFHYVDEPAAVVVLPFTPDGDVVLVEEWRQAVGRVNRGLPAGTLEPDDDDVAAAARRELAEETGYEAGSLERVASVEPANGLLNSVHHHFVARDCEPTGEQRLDDNESIRVAVEPYDDVLAAALDGGMRDGRALLGILRYELSGRWR